MVGCVPRRRRRARRHPDDDEYRAAKPACDDGSDPQGRGGPLRTSRSPCRRPGRRALRRSSMLGVASLDTIADIHSTTPRSEGYRRPAHTASRLTPATIGVRTRSQSLRCGVSRRHADALGVKLSCSLAEDTCTALEGARDNPVERSDAAANRVSSSSALLDFTRIQGLDSRATNVAEHERSNRMLSSKSITPLHLASPRPAQLSGRPEESACLARHAAADGICDPIRNQPLRLPPGRSGPRWRSSTALQMRERGSVLIACDVRSPAFRHGQVVTEIERRRRGLREPESRSPLRLRRHGIGEASARRFGITGRQERGSDLQRAASPAQVQDRSALSTDQFEEIDQVTDLQATRRRRAARHRGLGRLEARGPTAMTPELRRSRLSRRPSLGERRRDDVLSPAVLDEERPPPGRLPPFTTRS